MRHTIKDYRDAVEYLRANPDRVYDAWKYPYRNRGGCLFTHCTPSGRLVMVPGDPVRVTGCPVMVAGGLHVAWTPQLTAKIRASGLPGDIGRVTGEHLSLLANLQMFMDVTIRKRSWREENVFNQLTPWPERQLGDDCDVMQVLHCGDGLEAEDRPQLSLVG